jgi:hypothetical protein
MFAGLLLNQPGVVTINWHMIFKKIILVLLFPFIANLVVSCCNCLDTLIHHYTNKTISVVNLDNSGQEAREIPSGSVIKTAYGIRVKLSRENIACIEKPPIIFGEPAYAYDCRCPPSDQFLPNDSIAAIRVITLTDFNSSHPANTDVSTYFKVYTLHKFSTLDYFVKNTDASFSDEKELQATLDLLLMTPPDSNGPHQFRVQIVLSDGRTLEQNTSTIDFI